MCNAYGPPISSAQCPPKKRRAQPKPTAGTRGRSKKIFHQLSLHECVGTTHSTPSTPAPSIEASGDMLRDKEDGIVRFAFQNVNGISLRDNLHLMPEVATIGALQLDIVAFSETNLHWSHHNKLKMQTQMSAHLGSSQIVCASGTSRGDCHGYHPGGAMLAVVGPQCGRMQQRGSDPWGRFAWTTMRGGRDEGLLIISAYRVCQKKGAKVGVNTAYTQQINEMIQSGDKSMDPRSRVLHDLRLLIDDKRSQGFRPIVMLDANDDWTHDKQGQQFRTFMTACNLTDPLHDKFQSSGITSSTYARGSRRIDYILVDTSISPSIKNIGSLGLHEGIISDHVMLYMDCDENELFRGIQNRPVISPSREFILEQADKCEAFVLAFRKLASEKKFQERAIALSKAMHCHGATETLVSRFQILDKEVQECLLAVARKVVKKKFGYQRSPVLTREGMTLHFWKAVLSAKRRRAPLPDATIRQATTLAIPIATDVTPLSTAEARKKVRDSRASLWKAQKEATQNRVEWLEHNAQNIARAAGEVDWKKKMDDMIRYTAERGLHRRMTQTLKGSRQGLDKIEVPIFKWFHSSKTNEIYRYDQGVFEAYAPYTPQPLLHPTNSSLFYTHHHLKALPDDATPASVQKDGPYYRLVKKLPQTNIWREVSDAREIERLIIHRNERHLQQADIEEGRMHSPIIQQLMLDHGTTDLVDDLYRGKIDMETCTDEAIQAWLRTMRKTPSEIALPPITGEITKDDFQMAFKAVKERTSSSPSGLHYSIWKCLARENDFAEWLSILMSLPFQFGFANTRWTHSVDVMLEKSPGVRHIHKLRIIGLVEADFNTALKILFARKLMKNAESSGLHNEQWGGRPNRTSIDAALRKLLTFEYGRYMKMTIALFANDQTACFDRMCPAISNMIAGKFGMDVNVLRARSKTMAAMQRKIKTNLGISTASYGNRPGAPIIQGEYQGKGDVASLWVMQSSTILEAHSSLYSGLSLPSVSTMAYRSKNNDVYVDDADTWASSCSVGPDATTEVLTHIANGAQHWTNCQDVCAGATAFDKCIVQCLAWKAVKQSLVIDMEVPINITLCDIKGAASTIKQLRANEPNVGLGFHLAPDGNQLEEFRSYLNKIRLVCAATTSMHLTHADTRVMLRSQLIPKLWYGLHLSQFMPRQCKTADILLNTTFLPRMGIHRKTKLAVVYGSTQRGGHAFINTQLLNDQANFMYILQTLRWNNETADDLLHTLDALQIASGFVSPILSNTTKVITYLGRGLLLHIRHRLGALDGSIWVERAWQPALQRLHDSSMMEEFLSLPITPRLLLLANECRIWLRVITIAELANIDGRTIDIARLCGQWRAKSSLNWPNQPPPSGDHWAAFRKCIRMRYCSTASAWQRNGKYLLDHPLGMWIPAVRHIQHTFHKTQDGIIVCDESGLTTYAPTGISGHYSPTGPCHQIPLSSHPIQAQYTARGIWTHRKYRLHQVPSPHPSPIVVHDTFRHTSTQINVVSDASVHSRLCKAAIAWMIAESPENQGQAISK